MQDLGRGEQCRAGMFKPPCWCCVNGTNKKIRMFGHIAKDTTRHADIIYIAWGLAMLIHVGSRRRPRVEPTRSAGGLLSQLTGKIIVAAIFVLAASASSGAMAQNCGPLPSVAGVFPVIFDWKLVYGAGMASANAVAASINATNTAFLTHSTALVGAPADPPPDSQGGGVWARVIGGNDTTKSSGGTSFNFVAPAPANITQSGSTSCSSTFKQTFVGYQVGTDISRLNIGGWNIHLGTTAG